MPDSTSTSPAKDEGKKRKLSVASALRKDDLKRTKTDEAPADAGAADGADDADDAEAEAAAADDDEATPGEAAEDPGPATFLLWADALASLLDGEEDEESIVRRKDSVLAARAQYSHLAPDAAERDDALGAAAASVGHWLVLLEEGDGAADARREKLLARYEALADDEGWWYELDAQRAPPAGDAPGLLVSLDGDDEHAGGAWWFVDVRPAEEGVVDAMEEMVDHFASATENM